jgi:hypothetical protein
MACGSVIGWGIMLKAGRPPVRIPDEVDFLNLPGVDSASNRNEYQECSWGLKAAVSLSMSRMSESVGASTSRNPKSLHGLYRDSFTFTLFSHSYNIYFSI